MSWFDFFRKRREVDQLDAVSRKKIQFLEEIFECRINNPALFLRALRHRSRLGDTKLERTDSYERLEFLGDAVLDLSCTELLFEAFPKEDEGVLTKLRSQLVKGDSLSKYAHALGFSNLIDVSKRARSQNVQFSENVMADVFEALIGALFKDQGYAKAREFSQRILNQQADLSSLKDQQDNYKSTLLEYSQSRKLPQPVYEIIQADGPDHDKTFEIDVYLDGRCIGHGTGKSKKRAEQEAAREGLLTLGILS